jgi:iron complex outermembrane receptor protein
LTDKVAVDARAGNVFNRNYALTAYGSQQWILGRPRSVDVSLRFAY